MSDDDDGHVRIGSSGIGFLGILAAGLTVLFIYLKMTHQIDWAWWQVILPALIYVFGGMCCCCPILIIVCILAGTAILASVGLEFLGNIIDTIIEHLPKKKKKISVTRRYGR